MVRATSRIVRGEASRRIAVVACGILLLTAVWLQRTTIVAAGGELRSMPLWVVATLIGVGLAERAVRVDIYRSLLGSPGYADAALVHETGAAASKGLPMGGAVGTALRWSVARDRSIPTSTFAVALIATSAASVFVTFTLPLVALGIDLTQRSPESMDFVVAGICATVVIGTIAVWTVLLGSDRIHRWAVARCRRVCARLGRRFPGADHIDPETGIDDVRTGLRTVAARPWGLVSRTIVAQLCSAAVLLIALRSVGIGAELGNIEFLRVYFIVTLLGSFIPTPGGVGVIEAGLTGALVAAGAAPAGALAAVLVYRAITYVMPIMIGAAMYVVWRSRTGAASAPCVEERGEVLALPPASLAAA
jgi:putative heme transporter